MDQPTANQSQGRKTMVGRAPGYPMYTLTDKDNSGLGRIRHDSDLQRPNLWATLQTSILNYLKLMTLLVILQYSYNILYPILT